MAEDEIKDVKIDLAESMNATEISFQSIKYCRRGHGQLPKDYRCPECSKVGLLSSPLFYVVYGISACLLSFYYINFDASLTKLGSGAIYLYICFPPVIAAWGIAMAFVQMSINGEEKPNQKTPSKSSYRRSLDCPQCGAPLDREGWCAACSRRRSRPLTQLLVILMPLLGVGGCFSSLIILYNATQAGLLILAICLMPVIYAVWRFRQSLPQR